MGIRQHKRTLSVGTKVLLSHLLLCVAIILLAGALSYVLTSQYMKESHIDDLLEKAGRIAESSRQMPEGEFVPSWRIVRTYAYLTDAKVFYLDADTEDIRMIWYEPESERSKDAESKPPAAQNDKTGATKPQKPVDEADYQAANEDESGFQWMDVRDSIDREFAARVLAGERVSAMRHFEFAQGEIIFAGAPILDDQGVVRGGVILAQPVTELHSLSKMVGYMLVFVMSISLLLAVVLAMQLTRMLTSPIQRITRAARRMESGVYVERITQLPGDEIGELGHALNSMSGRLMDVIRNLRKERNKLEMVIAGMDEGLIAVDNQGNIVHANAAFLELTEVRNAGQLLDGSERFEPLVATLWRCMNSGEAETVVWENPSHRAILATFTARRDDTGMVAGVVCLMRDVSEAQRVEQLRRD